MAEKLRPENDELDINIDLLGIARRRYLHVLFGVLLGVTGAVLFYFRQTPVYEAKLSILVGQRSSEITRTGTAGGEESTTVQEEILSTHMELFGSRKILENAVKKANLEGPRELNPSLLVITKGGEGVAKNASIIKATYQSPDPTLAADTLQAIYDSYKSYIDEKSKNIGTEAAELIAKSLVENETSLRKAEEEYRDYVAKIPGLVSTSSSGGGALEDVHRMRLRNLEDELAEVRKSLSQSESRYEVIREFSKGKNLNDLSDVQVLSLMEEKEVQRLLAFVSITTNQGLETSEEQLARASQQASAGFEYQKLLDLVSRRDKLQSVFGTKHPAYLGVAREIESMQRYIEEMRSKNATADKRGLKATPAEMLSAYVRVLESDIAELKSREKGLLELSEEEARQAKEVETAFLLSNSLKANLDRARMRYDEVFERLQEINLTNNYTGFSTDLIVHPFASGVPVWPSTTRILGLGLLAGAFFGGALALLAEFTDRTFKDPKDVESVVCASILAHLPRFEFDKLEKLSAERKSSIGPSVVTYHAPRGSAAETFRVLRTSVLYLSKKDNKQVWMITSPSPGDGKSTTIANLAVSLAQTGKKILLIDGDLRRPTVGKSFGLTDKSGLTDYLRDSELQFKDVCHISAQENLTLCPCGSVSSKPAELLESDRFVQFLAEARQAFDIVLVDAPPVLAVADPAIIVANCDGCLLTVRIQKNNRGLVERAAAILSEGGVTPDGVIVNGRDKTGQPYGYSSYNYYGKSEYGYVKSYRNYYATSATESDDA